jgi:hypothetical protein
MYKINEILTPAKFVTCMLQIILTIVIGFTKSDNILMSLPSNLDKTSSEYSAADASY